MRLSTWLSALFGSVLLTLPCEGLGHSATALRCGCGMAPSTLTEARTYADLVLTGRIVRMEALTGVYHDTAALMRRLPRGADPTWEARLAIVAVDQQWKGARADTVRLVALSNCDIGYDYAEPRRIIGTSVLLYASHWTPESIRLTRAAGPALVSAFACGRSQYIQPSEPPEDLKALGPPRWRRYRP